MLIDPHSSHSWGLLEVQFRERVTKKEQISFFNWLVVEHTSLNIYVSKFSYIPAIVCDKNDQEYIRVGGLHLELARSLEFVKTLHVMRSKIYNVHTQCVSPVGFTNRPKSW